MFCKTCDSLVVKPIFLVGCLLRFSTLHTEGRSRLKENSAFVVFVQDALIIEIQ